MSPGQIDSSSTKSVGIGTPVAVDSAALEIETSHSHIQHALNKIEPGPEKDSTMHGLPLVVFTVGMMSIVFLMCFDHYILGMSKDHPLSITYSSQTSHFTPSNYNRFQHTIYE